MRYVNATPHDIVTNDGTVYPKTDLLARVSTNYSTFNAEGVCLMQHGAVEGLPEYDMDDGIIYIVSAMVLSASKRGDLVAPATGHPDAKRNEKGHIVSVPGFVQY